MGMDVLGLQKKGCVCQKTIPQPQSLEHTKTKKVVEAAICTLALLALVSGVYLGITLKQVYDLRFDKVSIEDSAKGILQKTDAKIQKLFSSFYQSKQWMENSLYFLIGASAGSVASSVIFCAFVAPAEDPDEAPA